MLVSRTYCSYFDWRYQAREGNHFMPKNEKNLFALVQGYKIENLSDSYNVLSNETFQEYEANFTNRIPEYQRNYVATVDWATTLVKSMLADLLDSDEEISTYCLQNITVQELVTKDGQIIKFVRNIVDGQQRITTFLIFCTATACIWKESNPSNKMQQNFERTVRNAIQQFDGSETVTKTLNALLDGEEVDDNLISYIYTEICTLIGERNEPIYKIVSNVINKVTVTITELRPDECAATYYKRMNLGTNPMLLSDLVRCILAHDDVSNLEATKKRADALNTLIKRIEQLEAKAGWSNYGKRARRFNLEDYVYRLFISVRTHQHIENVGASSSKEIAKLYEQLINELSKDYPDKDAYVEACKQLLDFVAIVEQVLIGKSAEINSISAKNYKYIQALRTLTATGKTASADAILCQLIESHNHGKIGEKGFCDFTGALFHVILRNSFKAQGKSDNSVKGIDNALLDSENYTELIKAKSEEAYVQSMFELFTNGKCVGDTNTKYSIDLPSDSLIKSFIREPNGNFANSFSFKRIRESLNLLVPDFVARFDRTETDAKGTETRKSVNVVKRYISANDACAEAFLKNSVKYGDILAKIRETNNKSEEKKED